MASITLRGFCFFYLAVVLCLVKLQAVPSSECGNWQRNYRTLHQDILNNKLDPAQVKFLISIAPPQGLADRIGGYITHFLFALLSDRAYLQITLPLDVPMSAAYDCKFVDSDMWSHLQNSNGAFHDSFGVMQDEFLALPIGGYRTINKYIAEHPKTTSKPIDLSTNYGEYLNGGPDMTSKQRIGIRKKNKQLFVGSDFNALPFSDKKRVFFLGNRGFSYAMFDNPHHNATLVSMGLTRDNAFRCVYQFLFGFNMQLHCSEVGGCKHMWDAVRDRHTAGGTVIGVHVRVGDAVFTKGITGADDLNGQLWGMAEPFLQCALSLRTELSPSPPLLFLSDSVELRKMVLSRLGSDIIIVSSLDGYCVGSVDAFTILTLLFEPLL